MSRPVPYLAIAFGLLAFGWLAMSVQAQERGLERQAERVLIEQSNAFRAEEGLEPLAENRRLMRVSQEFAEFMASEDEPSHTADGKTPKERADDGGYESCLVSENIGYQFSSRGFTAERLAGGLVEGWKGSEVHRENLLDPDMTEIGVGIAKSAETGRYYAVQMFGRPQSKSISFQVENRTAETVEYEIDGDRFELQRGFVATHERCRPAEISLVADEDDEEPAAANVRQPGTLRIEEDASGKRRLVWQSK